MENKDSLAGKRKAIFILKNENKTYAEFAKLLKISISDSHVMHHFHPIKTNPAGTRPPNLMTKEI
jgi:5-methylcytosine-specific restriction endonuclease McrA